MLDLQRLRLLSELSRRETIAGVAQAVGDSPTEVSESLAQLERDAGFPLLEQNGDRLRLTPAAQGLMSRAERLLAELDTAEAELAAEEGTVRGDLALGAFPGVAAALLEPVTQELSERHPELSFTVSEHEPEDGLSMLRSGKLDLVLCESYEGLDAPVPAGLEQHEVMREPLLLVLGTPHPAREPVELQTLRDAAWITGGDGSQLALALEHSCRAAGFEPRIAHPADDPILHKTLAAGGLGVGMLPALDCTERHGVRFARISPPVPHRQISALVRHPAEKRPALMITLEALRLRGSIVAAEGRAGSPELPEIDG